MGFGVGGSAGGLGSGAGAEVLPFLVWSRTCNIVERRPTEAADLARVIRQIDACRERRQRLVLGGANAIFIIAAYLALILAPVVPVREVVRLLETKLPDPMPSHVADDVAAYAAHAAQALDAVG